MGLLLFIGDYFVWHYGQAIKEGINIWKIFFRFFNQFFSMSLLLRTLFSPWRRMKEYYGRGFDPKQYFEIFILNLVMRGVGFVLRMTIIAIGLAAELAVFVIGIIAFFIWLMMPIVIVWFFAEGIILFFQTYETPDIF